MIHSEDVSYHIISLGCSKNQTDSERLNGGLQRAGFFYADSAEDADIIIVNTCGFIEDAKTESIDVILEAADISTGGLSNSLDEKKLVVTGCLSQRYLQELRGEMPEIDLVYGLVDDNLVAEICRTFDISSSPVEMERKLLVPSPFEYIKIAEGCSNNCSYCAIPLIRGGHVSAPVSDILDDARNALERGARELVIIAQDIAAYSYKGDDLYSLVQKISDLGENFWIRLMYCHPDRISGRMLDLFSDIPGVVPYIDVPMQHVNGTILNSMNRKGDAQKYRSLVESFRSKIPGIAVRTTFMVGYPGETDEQFKELLEFAGDMKFDRGGVFRYSPEENTQAAELEGAVDEDVAIDRYNRLSELMEDTFRSRLKSRIGSKVAVLVEQQTGVDQWIGRSVWDAPEVDGIFYLTGTGNLLNSIVQASVTDAVEFDLVGEL